MNTNRFLVWSLTSLTVVCAGLVLPPLARCDVAAEPQNLIAKPDFPPQGREVWVVPRTGKIQESYFDATVGGVARKAGRFVVKPEPGEGPHKVWISCSADTPVKQGDPLAVRVWLRSPEGIPVTIRLQDGDAKASFLGKRELTPEWKEYEVRGTARRDYNAKEYGVWFYMGHAPGTIEMTGLRLLPAASLEPLAETAPSPTAPALAPIKSVNLLKNGDFAEAAANWEGAADSLRGKVTFVAAQAGPFKRAVHVVSTPGTTDRPWTVSMRQTILSPLKKDDKLTLRLWLRASAGGKVGVVVEERKTPFTKAIDNLLRVTPQWTEYEVQGIAPDDFVAGEARLSLYMSFEPTTVEITGVHLSKGGSP